MFDCIHVSWLLHSLSSSVSQLLEVDRKSPDLFDHMMQQAVDRGLTIRAFLSLPGLCFDETSFKRRHEIVTIVIDDS